MPANYPSSQPALKTTFADNSPYSEELITKGLNQPNLETNAIAGELGNNPKAAALEARAASASAVVNLLGQLKQGIKDILGTTNWYDAAGSTIAAIWAKFHATTGHSHSGAANDGPLINSNGLDTDAVITNRIENLAVTAAKLAADSVTTAKILDGNVTQAKIDTTLKGFREDQYDFVASGGVWTADSAGSTKNGSMTAVVAYIGGLRVTASAITAKVFTASKDTYVDLGSDGVVDYNEVANNAASPALAASHLRLAVVTTDGTDINNANNINQGQFEALTPTVSSRILLITDSLGNLIYNRSPSPGLVGYAVLTSPIDVAVTENPKTILSTVIKVPVNRNFRIISMSTINKLTTAGWTNVGIAIDGTFGASQLVDCLVADWEGVNVAHAGKGNGSAMTITLKAGVQNDSTRFNATVAGGSIDTNVSKMLVYLD